MRTIETNTRITIKKAIDNHPLIAKALRLNTPELDNDIEKFADITGINAVFIKQNLQQIRNWI